MARFQLELAQARYHHNLPDDCFLANIPIWLKDAPDNVVFPSYDLTTEDGSKWIKFSDFEDFMVSILSFWNENKTKDPIPMLRMVVMPYASIHDAYLLHKRILQPDLLPISYMESIQNQNPVEIMHVQNGQEQEDDDIEITIAEEREAAISLDGFELRFFVINYGLLWVKSEKFCWYQFMTEAFRDVLSRFDMCDQKLQQPNSSILENLAANLVQARRQLIFAMYRHDVNPHDMLLWFFPHVHDEVYLGCVHCDQNIEDDNKLDSADTMLRLYGGLVNIGLHQHLDEYVDLSFEKAQENLVSAHGRLEDYQCEFDAMQRFTVAKQQLRECFEPILSEFHVISHRPSVLGVPSPIDEMC